MKAKIHDLAHWKRFCDTCRKEKELFCSGKTLSTFNCFYARYRLATHFEAIQVRGYSKRTLRGYSAGLRLLLAYNAAELLGTAIKCDIHHWEINEPKLARDLRTILDRPLKRSEDIFFYCHAQEKTYTFQKRRQQRASPRYGIASHGGTWKLHANWYRLHHGKRSGCFAPFV